MIKTTMNHNTLIQSLFSIFQTFEKNGDLQSAEKMKQLIQKTNEREHIIALCGHFSAGKSSMINFLLGEQVLPSSPIPTSANLVKVMSGEEFAKVFYFHDEPALFPAPYDLKEVKKYCKDGDAVKEIHISSPVFPLPSKCSIMDTPGIDSTDDAHRVSTESALHLADIIFYVMDYNHVQSEVNFLFTKELTDAGKKLYLIVNMIDKHEDKELSFDTFQNSVEQAFAEWNVKPEGIFYTSVRDLDHPKNDIQTVKSLMFESVNWSDDFTLNSIFKSAERLVEQHIHWLQDQNEERLSEEIQLLEYIDVDSLMTMETELTNLKKSKQVIYSSRLEMEQQFQEELSKTLNNAYLMPAETRELIRMFIESQQKTFKVGLLFSKGKTEQTRLDREKNLFDSLKERIQTQLDWSIKELCLSAINNLNLYLPNLEKSIQEISIALPEQQIKDMVKEQSTITGDYVLLFSNEVADLLKKQARQLARRFFEEIQKEHNKALEEQLSQMTARMNEIEKFVVASEKVKHGKIRLAQYSQEFQQALTHAPENMDPQPILEKWANDEKIMRIISNPKEELAPSINTKEEVANEVMVHGDHTQGNGKHKLELATKKLIQAARFLSPVKGFSQLAKELQEKAKRLDNQTFTIALFGAFSAGKSSFANALIGERILPVSPNPTTAVINKIVPPTEGHDHGTAKVRLKSEEMLFEDIKIAMNAFKLSPKDLEDAYHISRNFSYDDSGDGREKAHLSFIKAFASGYPLYKGQFGTEIMVDMQEFQDFAANETKSCLVDWIELYWDCEFTRNGMVLVDTPGADSINARHTDAAFEYIKNSDAILFVTYYNHPFSKADREFLIQLGRVKDSFAMDKMFFLLNAVDLAQTEEECEDVKTYIQEQLLGFGIRFPKIYPISSKEAIAEKTGNTCFQHAFLKDSGMSHFEEAFYRFISYELTDLAISSAMNSVSNAVLMLEDMLMTAKQSHEQKEQTKQAFKAELAAMRSVVDEVDSEVELGRMHKEVDELLFYARQRVFLRFSDFFKESFNPAVIKDDGRDLKQALQASFTELKESLGFDLAQEMRATAFRVELYIQKLLQQKQSALLQEIQKVRRGINLSFLELKKLEALHFEDAFKTLKASDFKKELSLFKNTKSFFEKNEKQKMSDALQEGLKNPAQDYADQQGHSLKTYYGSSIESEILAIKQHFIRSVEEIFEGYNETLLNSSNIEEYEILVKDMKELLK
ncbi:dynamin family protein [Peribacillus acanthi]|uniref:dynamin family protein n=1 Tax=Peribacillus acanthi TaxID=2171554 RepID=UPI000D3E9F6D|nr:dynamin family protein [Peribacillus acanthi]